MGCEFDTGVQSPEGAEEHLVHEGWGGEGAAKASREKAEPEEEAL